MLRNLEEAANHPDMIEELADVLSTPHVEVKYHNGTIVSIIKYRPLVSVNFIEITMGINSLRSVSMLRQSLNRYLKRVPLVLTQ